MAKKPAFLFYSNDYFEGTRTMLPEERACYVDLMVYQHQHDYIPNDIKRITMYCVGVSEATLIATLEAKFKLCEKGWYNERLQQVMNGYEEHSKDKSDNGTYGQFIKKLNQDKSIKNLTELKDFIKNVYTKERLIEDLKKDNDYKATLEALLKLYLSSRVENENEDNIAISFLNNSNNNNAEVSKKSNNEPSYSELQKECKEKMERYEATFLLEDLQNFIEHFKSVNVKENEIKQAMIDFKLNKMNFDKPAAPYTYKNYKEWFKKYITDNRAKYVHVPKFRVTYIDKSVPRLELHAAFNFYWQEEYTLDYIHEKILSGEFSPKNNLNYDRLIDKKLILTEND